ncbi:MAG: DNA repair protein RadC [Candidatus Accumulibacter delftensis]|jgi:DNA repair protein RadC
MIHSSNRELLSIVLGDEAALLATRSLAELFGLRPPRQTTTLGAAQEVLPYAVHDRLMAARELLRRALAEELAESPVSLSSPRAVGDYLRLFLGGQEYESFVALWLDAQNRLIAGSELFRGTVTQTSVYPREVVKAGLRLNASAVILAHNHPSGHPEPSRADELLTSELKNALALVDIRVLDHFIVADTAVMSFAERGLI